MSDRSEEFISKFLDLKTNDKDIVAAFMMINSVFRKSRLELAKNERTIDEIGNELTYDTMTILRFYRVTGMTLVLDLLTDFLDDAANKEVSPKLALLITLRNLYQQQNEAFNQLDNVLDRLPDWSERPRPRHEPEVLRNKEPKQ